MALSRAAILAAVQKAFVAAGDVIRSGMLGQSTSTYDTTTGKTVTNTVTAPCRVLWDGLVDKSLVDGTTVQATDKRAYVSGLSVAPKELNTLSVDGKPHRVVRSEDVSAGSGHLWLLFVRDQA